MDAEEDYYGILGLALGASDREIEQAYRGLARKWHPDRHNQNEAERRRATAMFQLVAKAKEVLLDAEARRAYDDVVRAREEERRRREEMDSARKSMIDELTMREKLAGMKEFSRENELKSARTRLERELERLRKMGRMDVDESEARKVLEEEEVEVEVVVVEDGVSVAEFERFEKYVLDRLDGSPPVKMAKSEC